MHILIIGAGLAGLTCARVLQQRGVRVSLFEASDGVGGRVRSDERDGYILDRGFQVVFDSYPAVQRHLDLPALQLRRFDPGAIICYKGQRSILTNPLRDRQLQDIVQAFLTPVVSPVDKLRTLALALQLGGLSIDEVLAGNDLSTLAFLREQGFSEAIIQRFFRPFYGGIFLDRSLETSAKCFKFDFKMLATGNTAVPAHGIGAIAEQLAQPLFATQSIRLHTAVEALEWRAERVCGVRLASGERIEGDRVVVATAAPQAAQLTGLEMPAGQQSTVTLYFQGDKLIYSGKKLVLHAADDAFVNNAQLISTIAPSYAPAGKHLLSVTILGAPHMSDEELYRAALADLQRMFAGDLQAQAAIACYQPLACYRIPYAQFPQPPGVHPQLPENQTRYPGLYLAGEYTEASSLNAAMISGEKCATILLAAV